MSNATTILCDEEFEADAATDAAIDNAPSIQLEACELERDRLPSGTITLESAIARCVVYTHRRALSHEGEAIWHHLCKQIEERTLRPLALTPSGETFEPARDQFHGLPFR